MTALRLMYRGRRTVQGARRPREFDCPRPAEQFSIRGSSTSAVENLKGGLQGFVEKYLTRGTSRWGIASQKVLVQSSVSFESRWGIACSRWTRPTATCSKSTRGKADRNLLQIDQQERPNLNVVRVYMHCRASNDEDALASR
jgi:hypothetical protein